MPSSDQTVSTLVTGTTADEHARIRLLVVCSSQSLCARQPSKLHQLSQRRVKVSFQLASPYISKGTPKTYLIKTERADRAHELFVDLSDKGVV